jgi:ParB/Sulfiredoxin domain
VQPATSGRMDFGMLSNSSPAGSRAPITSSGRTLAIKRVPIESLVPDPANARAHPERNLQSVVASPRRFGQAEPLIVQAGTHRVIGGHARLAAMRTLGWTECDIVELEIENLDATALGIALSLSVVRSAGRVSGRPKAQRPNRARTRTIPSGTSPNRSPASPPRGRRAVRRGPI